MELSYGIHQHLIGQRLSIEGYFVGVYPVSYTVGECLENWCGEVEWDLDQYTYSDYTSGSGGAGIMTVDRLNNKVSYRRILLTAELRCNT